MSGSWDDEAIEKTRPLLGGPKRKMARFHRLELRNGYTLEVGWDFQRSVYLAKYTKTVPDGDTDNWGDGFRKIWGLSVKEVLGIARREFAEIANPDIKKVREKVQGKIGISYQNMRDTMDKMMVSIPKGNPKIYMNPRQHAELMKQIHLDDNEKLGIRGLSPAYAIIDERLSEDSIFSIRDDDILDALKYGPFLSDKKRSKE